MLSTKMLAFSAGVPSLSPSCFLHQRNDCSKFASVVSATAVVYVGWFLPAVFYFIWPWMIWLQSTDSSTTLRSRLVMPCNFACLSQLERKPVLDSLTSATCQYAEDTEQRPCNKIKERQHRQLQLDAKYHQGRIMYTALCRTRVDKFDSFRSQASTGTAYDVRLRYTTCATYSMTMLRSHIPGATLLPRKRSWWTIFPLWYVANSTSSIEQWLRL